MTCTSWLIPLIYETWSFFLIRQILEVTRVEILDFVNKNTYKIVEKIELGNVLGIIVFFRKLSVNTRRRPVGGSKPRAPAFLSACPQNTRLTI